MIPQEVINLYDEYTHKPLSRRDFMSKLTSLVGSSAAALALLPILQNNYAVAAIVPENDREIEVLKQSKNGINYYIAKPKNGTKLKTVLVVHENRGLNPHIQDITRRLAKEGFLAIAPDGLSLVGGTPTDEDKAREMIKNLDALSVEKLYLEACSFANSHESSNQSVGIVGFCWGGGVANTLSATSKDIKASVAYYGMQPKAEDVEKIKIPLMLHYAGLDKRINAGITDFVDALTTFGVEFNLHYYKGVNHAFNNDTNTARYDKKAAELSWKRTVEFLNYQL